MIERKLSGYEIVGDIDSYSEWEGYHLASTGLKGAP